MAFTFIPPEEVGMILSRLVRADDEFTEQLIQTAEKAGDKLLPDDYENLTDWIVLMKIIKLYF